MIGTTISHYKILEKLGEGGMGVVYKAEDNKLKRPVALKFISPVLTRSREANERFIFEAQTASALDHQNISTIYEINESIKGRMFISMAYYKGDTLRKIISGGKLPIKKTIDYTIQIAGGLSKAHKKGIIHKDIKPANIIIDEDDIVKIIDFGLSKLQNTFKLEFPKSTMGTVPYMSPEQIEGKEIDQLTDIWSLGVVMYEMLTGIRPFEGEHDQAVIYSILNEDPELITNLVPEAPPALQKILTKVLAKNPDKRYNNTEELLIDLRNLTILLATRHDISLKNKKYIRSLAVLPLLNLSNNPDQEYFTDGMTDALITELAKIRAFKVISRTSIMHYKSTQKSLPEIAKELNVDTIVEGSVLREEKKVQITVQLIDAPTDAHLWAETYERDLQDVINLQGELVRTIASKIKVSLTTKEVKRISGIRPVSPEPYDNYLKGCFHLYKVLPDHFNKAIEYFQLALDKDPSFALAYTGIANVWFVRCYWSITPAKESMLKAKQAVLKALELDDTLEEAHDIMARIKFFYDWDWNGAEKEFKKAIQLNPNYADSHLFYSAFLRSMKRDKEAQIQVNKGLELDPISSFSQGFLVGHMLHLAQYDEAIIKLREIQKTEPNSPLVHRYLWIAYHQKQNFENALDETKKYFSSIGKSEIADLQAFKHSEVGYHKVMELVADRLKELTKETYIQPIWIARLYAYAKNNELAIEWLQIAHKERDPLIVNLEASKDWDNLRDEPKFKVLLRQMNFN